MRVRETLKKEGKDVGKFVNDITLHTLRRTFATHLAEFLPLLDISFLMGHSSINVTEKYYIYQDKAHLAQIKKKILNFLTTD